MKQPVVRQELRFILLLELKDRLDVAARRMSRRAIRFSMGMAGHLN